MTLECLVSNTLRKQNMSTIKDEEELYQNLKNLSIICVCTCVCGHWTGMMDCESRRQVSQRTKLKGI